MINTDELFAYGGASPCPADFDAYWEKALQEMRDTDPQVELIPSKFQAPNAECFDLFFTGVRGARIHAKYLRPKNITAPCPALLNFHGYTGSSLQWWDKLSFAQGGFCFAALDCRGQSGFSQDPGGHNYFTYTGHILRGVCNDDPQDLLMRHIFLDTAMLARIVMDFEEVDENRVGAYGYSQGGGLTLACAALEPRIKKAWPVYPFLCDYKKAFEIETGMSAYNEIKIYFRAYDPLHEHIDEFFNRMGYIDVQNLAKNIKAEVLMQVGMTDVVCPPITQFAAYNKITSPKRVIFYPEFGHEALTNADDLLYQEFLTL